MRFPYYYIPWSCLKWASTIRIGIDTYGLVHQEPSLASASIETSFQTVSPQPHTAPPWNSIARNAFNKLALSVMDSSFCYLFIFSMIRYNQSILTCWVVILWRNHWRYWLGSNVTPPCQTLLPPRIRVILISHFKDESSIKTVFNSSPGGTMNTHLLRKESRKISWGKMNLPESGLARFKLGLKYVSDWFRL
jgi:hypothetical protein